MIGWLVGSTFVRSFLSIYIYQPNKFSIYLCVRGEEIKVTSSEHIKID